MEYVESKMVSSSQTYRCGVETPGVINLALIGIHREADPMDTGKKCLKANIVVDLAFQIN